MPDVYSKEKLRVSDVVQSHSIRSPALHQNALVAHSVSVANDGDVPWYSVAEARLGIIPIDAIKSDTKTVVNVSNEMVFNAKSPCPNNG